MYFTLKITLAIIAIIANIKSTEFDYYTKGNNHQLNHTPIAVRVIQLLNFSASIAANTIIRVENYHN